MVCLGFGLGRRDIVVSFCDVFSLFILQNFKIHFNQKGKVSQLKK